MTEQLKEPISAKETIRQTRIQKLAELADKAYAQITYKSSRFFDYAQDDTIQDDNSLVSSRPSLISYIALDKKKLNKILAAHHKSDLSEMFRLWLSEKGFRFPIGFFYAPKEPAHIKIPVRAVYRKRSILKIRHTVWICEFEDTETAAKFVS